MRSSGPSGRGVNLPVEGSDTIAHTFASITYYLAANSRCQRILQDEFDEALSNEDVMVLSYTFIKHLRYPQACVNEGMRLCSVARHRAPAQSTRRRHDGPRQVLLDWHNDQYSLVLCATRREYVGRKRGGISPGAMAGGNTAINKAFYPFSFGSRMCLGRNLVTMEMPMFVASLFRRYELVLEGPNAQPEIAEDHRSKMSRCRIGLSKWDV
ncbi:cytochrome P450 [Amylostereum chailletii]|nr:cytochrome P450 [Amylostereum chailletii]